MILNRYIVLNPVEPSPLSMRVSHELPVTLRLQFTTVITNAPINYDLKARMVLTGKTDGVMTPYDAISTDISNGKAQVDIPANTMKDRNGYRVRLFGDVKAADNTVSETLIAIGDLQLIVGRKI